MAVTIVRTNWIDDDGTGTTGTVINNAVKTALYNDIDGALAKVAQLAGGNALTGNQSVAGLLTVTGVGVHTFTGTGAGVVDLVVRNAGAGPTNQTRLGIGNDSDPYLMMLSSYSSTYTGGQPVNSSMLYAGGAGGLQVFAAGVLRLAAGNAERMRITPTGEVLINGTTSLISLLGLSGDLLAARGVAIHNTNVGNTGTFCYFENSAGGIAGTISHTAATTVAYNTTSDARLKDDAGRATELAALRAVVVHDFAWKADGRADRGVFAQDAHAVFPRAVTVGTDETTDDGRLARPWMTDYSKFVPDLIVGWQQHDATIADLIACLERMKG